MTVILFGDSIVWKGITLGKNEYEIELRNCRNISAAVDGAPLVIKKNALNVFYGKNGTGKTTVGLALKCLNDNSEENLKRLESFKYKESADPALAPTISCAPRIKSLHIFNDEWVESHCFVKDTLQSDAYELYVRDAEVRRLEKKRKDKLGLLNKALANGDVEDLRKALTALKKGLGGLKSNGEFKASAPVVKAFKNGVPIEPIPDGLSLIIDSMTARDKAQWLSWHIDAPLLPSAALCPYCGYEDAGRIDGCRRYDATREQNEAKQWAAIATMFDEVGDALSIPNSTLLRRVLGSKKPPAQAELEDLARLADDVASMLDSLDNLSNLMSDEQYMDAPKLISKLSENSSSLINKRVFLKSRQGVQTSAAKALAVIGRAASAVKSAQAELETLSNELVDKVAANIVSHEDEINAFLAQCGYEYKVSIQCNPQTSEAKVLLKSSMVKSDLIVEDPGSSLSYGERNALALALFMFEAINDPRALIVLDDPISSFDFDKRYGILHALFSDKSGVFKRNLRGCSVLAMTHDFLVVNDLINIPGKGLAAVKGNLLSCNGGLLSCQPLTRDSIAPYTQILQRKMSTLDYPLIVRLVYVRQFCELLRRDPKEKTSKESWTFRLLSGVIHARSADEVIQQNALTSKDSKWVHECENNVKRLTGIAVNYWDVLEEYHDCLPQLVEEYRKPGTSPMTKLILVRLMLMRDASLADDSSNILKRFADETCHIGGSYLFQLDCDIHNQVPFYVSAWCDEIVDKVASNVEAQCMD